MQSAADYADERTSDLRYRRNLRLGLCGWCRRSIRKDDAVHSLPIVSGHHLDRVPRTAIEERAVRSFAGALLTTDAEIWIDFDSSERRMVLIRDPEHTGFD